MHVEMAVPVADDAEGGDGVEAAALPAGDWLTLLHRGPYAHAALPDLGAAHAALRAWAEGHALALAGEGDAGLAGCVEQYRRGPVEEPDPTRWETELAYLVVPASG